MNFFDQWAGSLENTKYIHAFLAEKKYVNDIFQKGLPPEVEKACAVLRKISIERLVDCICRLQPKKGFDKSEVPIFSNFKNGAVRTPELLEFTPEGMFFDTLGYQLMQCPTQVAQKKYGENQGKLAAILGVAHVGDERPRRVTVTALGKYLNSVSDAEKKIIWQRMVLRNAYLQFLIQSAVKGSIKYKDTVACLATSNVARRRGNVRDLIELALKGSKKEYILQNIDWKV